MFICFKDKKGFFHSEHIDRIGFYSTSICADGKIKRFYIKVYGGSEVEEFQVSEQTIIELGRYLLNCQQIFKIGMEGRAGG
jgi:hypothetical protein